MDNLVLAVMLIGILGVGAQWIAWKFNLPAIVVMAAAGLIVGPLTGLLQPAELFGDFYEPIIQIAVAVILFEGGLQLRFSDLRGVGRGVAQLCGLGALTAWVLGSLAGHYIAGLTWPTAILFGGIMIVTGPTVIMPLLRQAKLSTRPAALLKWEGIVNDPVGALAAVIVFEFVRGQSIPDISGGDMIASLIFSSVLCVATGYIVGWAIAYFFRQGWVPEFLKAPVLLTAVLVAFAVGNFFQKEGGLIAVTVMGLTLANAKLPSINEIRHFKETVSTLLIAGVFIILTANLSTDILSALDWRMIAFVLVMLFVVRPASVMLSTMGTELKMNERLLVAWIAPRGIVAVAVSSLFAVAVVGEPAFPDGDLMIPLAFAMVFATVTLHGFTIAPLSRMLGLSSTLPPGVLVVGASAWSVGLAKRIAELDIPVLVADPDFRALRRAREAGLKTFFGEILSEVTEHHIEFSRYGYLLAVSSNEAHNALVCTDLAPEIGRAHTFQLSTAGRDDGRRNVSYALQGKSLMGGKVSLEDLMRRHYAGWTFQVTRLSDTFTPERYKEGLAEGALVVAAVRKTTLFFNSDDAPLSLQVGDRVISYTPPAERAELDEGVTNATSTESVTAP